MAGLVYVLYVQDSLLVVILYRLGEACSHVAAVISCLIEAAQYQQQTGTTACTSQKCRWLPTVRNVSFFDINFHSRHPVLSG